MLSLIDLSTAGTVYTNLDTETLIQHCLERDNCKLASNGAIVAYSGKYTGRTPKDKHTVREPGSEQNIWWENNNSMEPEVFARLRDKARQYAVGKTLYVVDTFGGADPNHRIAVRFIVERPYHALFIKQLLLRPTPEELANFSPDWVVANMSRMKTDPEADQVKGDATVALNFAEQQVIIAGTEYAGEMKKSVFTIMNYILPLKGVMSMHCSANIGERGDTALFFGLSGTGKTTLSADPERSLIGDDEHGWTNEGTFNVEGGCYAKCIRLSKEGEPEIWEAIRRGSVLENVILNEDGTPNYDSDEITENTRCAYPIDYIPNAEIPSVGGHPKNILFLTCDAFGILPPVAKLSKEQAMEFFLCGYTAKVAGTEAGVKEPTSTFSACFGAPFLPLHPSVYAKLLGEKIDRHESKVWLINTGWTGGPYGVGERMKLKYTRAMIHAIFNDLFDNVEFVEDPVFGISVPTSCEGVPSEILSPRNTWADAGAYDAQAKKLHEMFQATLAKFK